MKFLLIAALLAKLTAQSPDAKNDTSRFPGVWDLVSIHIRWPDGRVTQDWGVHPVGRIIYDQQGRVSALLMHADRNQSDGRQVPTEVAALFAGYYGTYSVDESRRVVTHHVAASLRAAESKSLERSYEFKDATLTLTARLTLDDQPVTAVLVWKRQP